MSEWQPIETAPKDEDTLILGWSNEDGIAIVIWQSWMTNPPRFAVVHDAEDYAYQSYAPTHWMPLPEAPKP